MAQRIARIVNRRFNPEVSMYHKIILDKYLRKGLSIKEAFKKAKREWVSSLTANNYW